MTGSAKQSIFCHTPRKRGIQYAAASRFYRNCSGILDRPLSRTMTATKTSRQHRSQPHHRDLAARCVRADAWNLDPRKQRVQGKPGARCTRSLACEIIKHTSVVTTGTPVSPGLPCAMVLTVSFVLSPVTGLSCHRRLANCFAKLDASVGASGPYDFAVRQKRSRLQHYRRPPHPAPHVRDDRETPLVQERDKMATTLVLPGRQANF
jgi:hypothetical protein